MRNAVSSKVKKWDYACAILAPCLSAAHETERGKRQVENGDQRNIRLLWRLLVLGKIRQGKEEQYCLPKFYLDEESSN